jgi:NAD(P)H-dependent flavin oxidoreductase YrpB (nitropropane dioxygenase family)
MAIGQSVGAINSIKSAKEVVEDIMNDARRTLERLSSLR